MLAHWQTRSSLLALFLLTYASTAEDANDPPSLPAYRSTVSEVRVVFFATDENNRPVTTLTKPEFAVVDNEMVVRDFRSFARSDETSLDVVALIDLSESVASSFRRAMSGVLQLVAREQAIANDSIAVLSFGGTSGGMSGGTLAGIRPVVLCASDCGTPDAAKGLLAARSGGTTPLFDALIFGADFMAHHRRAGARPVLILFSDGNDTISLHSQREALDGILAGGALIYSVDMGTSKNHASYKTSGSAFLRQVSEATGGRYFSLSSSSSSSLRSSEQADVTTVLIAVLDDLRASYVVTYDLPSHQAGFHSLRLLPTHNLNLRFHNRNGYYYELSGH